MEFLALEWALVFLALESGPEFLDLGQYLEPWPQLKQPSSDQEGSGPLEGLEILVEPAFQVVWQESDLLPRPPPPKLPPKPPNLAWGESVGSESEAWELVGLELSRGLWALEVCLQLQLLKQPNSVPLASEVS